MLFSNIINNELNHKYLKLFRGTRCYLTALDLQADVE